MNKIKESVKLNALKLSKNDTKQESRLKKLISSRLKTIEKLNRLLEGDRATLNNIKDLYDKNLSKEVSEHCKEIEIYIQKLLKRYGQKSFALYQKETLEYLIEENFNDLYFISYESESFEELVKEYNSLKQKQYGYDDEFEDEDDFWNEIDGDDIEIDEDFAKEMGDNIAKEIITEMLNNMGLDVDEDFFEGLDPKDKDFEEKLHQRLFEYSESQKNTEKTESARKKIITTDKEFTKLYKSLVKKIHPDLTTDETERLRREDLMKELSNVWKERDYYQLMILQSKIDPDFNSGIELNKSHLQQIADDLLEKTKDIEAERFQFKKAPENEFYFNNFFASSDRRILLHIEDYKSKLKSETRDIKENVLQLKTQKTTKAFLKTINDKMEDDFYNDYWV